MGENSREDSTAGLEARRDGLGGFSDWAAAMQVYYKTGPHPPLHGYYPGHVAPPPYVWGPQPVMPPYGAPPHPYFHGGVYHHPAIPGHAPPPPPPPPPAAYGYGVPATMVDLAVVRPKSAESGEGGTTAAVLMHPVGVAVAPANTVARPSIGLENGSDGSSGSDAVDVIARKRKFEVMIPDPLITRMDHVAITPGKDGLPCSTVATTSSESTRLATGLPSTALDEREAKRQRRKQSNRESARRSRLRKQAECEDLGTRVSTLTVENIRLRSEISKAREKFGQLAEEQVLLQQQIRAVASSAAEPFGVNLSSRRKPSPCREVEGKSRRGMALVHIKDDAADTSPPITLVLDDDAADGGALLRRDREGLVTRSLWGKSDTVKKTLSLVTGMERDAGAKSVKMESASNVLGSTSAPWNRQQRSKLEESVVATVA